MANVIEQWVGHYRAGSSDKVWAAAYFDDGYYEATWGRRGKDLSRQGHQLEGSAARDLFAKKVREKQAEGYREARFDDAYYGVASFGARVSSNAPLPTLAVNRPLPSVTGAASMRPTPRSVPAPNASPSPGSQQLEAERSAREWGIVTDGVGIGQDERGERGEL
ncbi:MAG: hypothetical protein DLM69_00200 [Candidatus Chloroheliales bacterium]|nr:MAG: hypothetical protein DLM69_00200 [Chloroflexota bacterium]